VGESGTAGELAEARRLIDAIIRKIITMEDRTNSPQKTQGWMTALASARTKTNFMEHPK
jgi:hypothetical protein